MRFVVVDRTNEISQADLAAYAAAQQRQLREHYAACFDGDGLLDEVRAASSPGIVHFDEFELRIENSDANSAAGALGVHDLSAGHCYYDLVVQSGEDWRVTLSHECLEARADRRLHSCVELDNGEIWDREVCDRVEADYYLIDAVPMSNFSTPECFEPPPGMNAGAIVAARGGVGGAYDWMGLSGSPNEVRPGGYAQRFDPSSGWVQVGQMRAYRRAVAALGLSRGAARRARARD